MFKFSKIMKRFLMLGVLSACLGFAFIGSSNKVKAGEPCMALCDNGLVCPSVYIEGVGCRLTGYCFPPDYDGQCPIVD